MNRTGNGERVFAEPKRSRRHGWAYASRSCVARRECPLDEISDIRDARTHVPSLTRAAGVSPPWFGNESAMASRFSLNQNARVARLAYASRS
jgi:hypothetical protein